MSLYYSCGFGDVNIISEMLDTGYNNAVGPFCKVIFMPVGGHMLEVYLFQI